jgi:DNA-binding MarR family transcriptional regulator/N-acetylglutamate synthase-like GNAT family acetyltransferase
MASGGRLMTADRDTGSGNNRLAHRVAAVRHFNRFYTRQIGIVRNALYDSTYNLTEARVIYELAQRDDATAGELKELLSLDGGYLSRLLRGFRDKGLITMTAAPDDRRRRRIRLSAKGRRLFAKFDAASQAEISALLTSHGESEQRRLISAMETIEAVLREDTSGTGNTIVLRPPEPGDMGRVVTQHAELYSREYGWDDRFEAMVAEIVGKFINNFDPRWERCWIAERDGTMVGSVFVVRADSKVAKLRLLAVDERARGLGIGERLVEECIRFAGRRGYDTLSLWTNSILLAARGIYEKKGFRLVHEEPHHSFGHDLIGETWELGLTAPEAEAR